MGFSTTVQKLRVNLALLKQAFYREEDRTVMATCSHCSRSDLIAVKNRRTPHYCSTCK